MLGVPPEHSAIGNMYTYGYFVIGYYYITTCHSKHIAGGFKFNGAFWWYGPLSEAREFF